MRKKIQRQKSGNFCIKRKQPKYRFHIKKKRNKKFCLKVFQERDLETTDGCKHCLVIVIAINYRSSLPSPQNRFDKCKALKLFYDPHCSLLLDTLNVNSSAN